MVPFYSILIEKDNSTFYTYVQKEHRVWGAFNIFEAVKFLNKWVSLLFSLNYRNGRIPFHSQVFHGKRLNIFIWTAKLYFFLNLIPLGKRKRKYFSQCTWL